MTAKARGYGQYQVPHQNFDWNHKTVTDSQWPWPYRSWRDTEEPVKVPHPWRAPCALQELTSLACSWFPLCHSRDTVYLSFQPFILYTSILCNPSHQLSHLASFSHELHVLINSEVWLTGVITSGSVERCLSGPLRLTGRLSELLLSLAPAASVYHEERLLLQLWLALISSIFLTSRNQSAASISWLIAGG